MEELFATEFMGVSVDQMVYAFLAVLGGFLGRWVSTLVLAYVARLASKTRTRVDDIFIGALSKPLGWAMVLTGIYVALLILPLPVEPVNVDLFLLTLTKGLSVILMVWFGLRLTEGIFDRWAELVGAGIAEYSRPSRIEGGCLVVTVTEAPVATELRWQQQAVFKRIEELAGSCPIDQIRVVVR